MRNNKVLVGILLLAMGLPFILLIASTLIKTWTWPGILPDAIGLRGWRHFLNFEKEGLKTLGVSILISGAVTFLTLGLTIPAAKAFAFYSFPGKGLVEILCFLPALVPMTAVAMGIHFQFLKLGIGNTYFGVILIQVIPCIPYSLRILVNVFEIIGPEYEEQARMLGGSEYQVFRHITLPMISPGIGMAGTMSFIISFSQYFLTFLMGGGKVVTFPMVMFPYIASGDRMLGSVYSVVFLFTAFIVLMLGEKAAVAYYGDRLKEYTYV